MNIHEGIRKRMAQGYTVHSNALGRVGQITHVSDNPKDEYPVIVTPVGRRGLDGATSFLRGDKVELKKTQTGYVVINVL